MYHLDDLTPEEMEPQNQPIITFLRRSYERKHLTGIQDLPDTAEQTTARVRQRLQTMLQPDQGIQLSSGILFAPQDDRSMVGPMKRQWKNYMSMLAIAAILTLVIGSTLFIFKQAQPNPNSAIVSNTPENQPRASVTASPNKQNLESLAVQTQTLLTKIRTTAVQWGQTHMYYNTYDNKQYPYNSSYLQATTDLEEQLATAKTDSELNAVIQATNELLFLQKQFEANFADKTPYAREHASDQEILTNFQLTGGITVIVSTAEQSIRVYQDGKLIKAFPVTTGGPATPTPVGIWRIEARMTNIVIKSSEPKDSPKWFPDTKVNYMLLFRSWGYYLYDLWWRSDHGPGTQFPHLDSGGNTVYANNSSNGNIEMTIDNAQWLYEHVSINTPVIIY